MGRRFSVRVQLQPGVLGKVWSVPHSWSSSRATIPFFFWWDFVVPAVPRGTWGVLEHNSPSKHSKNQIPDYFISQNSSRSSALSQDPGAAGLPPCSIPKFPFFPFLLRLCHAEFTARRVILSVNFFFFLLMIFLFSFESTG